ncbi:OmpA family protein [Colwellia sp. 6_MG-2023]|uniref:OmpA family protein n=1 Tax=Colwellia sp. 6_MG-2023 TaxID=3062676 RepID=UPI0026E38DAA|nr:OmpA family protein [Colwellia sp. 6_MG-2023]MDO6486399.1 OmpA family protein [Colwellia sp. 6_MG-2023]
MNKVLRNPNKYISLYLAMIVSALLLMACADTRVVVLEDSVEQQFNLADDDSDGVIKAREKCDGTTIGASVDNYGCGTKISTIEPFQIDIKFERNSSEIPAAAYAEISKLADILEKNSAINVLVEGHTSKVGTAALNKALSNARAEAVATVLENDFAIDKSRIATIGYGFERLEAMGDTEQDHAVNRRIMAEISNIENIDELKWTIYTVDQVN